MTERLEGMSHDMKPVGLRRLQQAFQAQLLRPSESSLTPLVSGTEKVSSGARVDVYVDAYRLRLLEVLRVDFPGLKAVVGEDEFRRLGLAYVDAHPSRHTSVRHFGNRLAQFLGTTSDYREQPALSEMAAFEWALGESFDAADAGVLLVQDIAGIDAASWPRMRFLIHPSVRRLTLRSNSPAVRQAVQEGQPAPTLQLTEVPMAWVLWRRELRTYYRSLPTPEAWALDAAADGARFEEICEGLGAWVPDEQIALQAAAFLKAWASDGLLSEVAL